MRNAGIATVLAALVTACAPQVPAQVPTLPAATGPQAPARSRAALETYVLTEFVPLKRDLERGTGPFLTQAMTLAGIPSERQPLLAAQLRAQRALYSIAPGALAETLWNWGG